MADYLRLHNFAVEAQRAYDAPQLQRLVIQRDHHTIVSSAASHFLWSSQSIREENRRTWTVFLQSLESELGGTKVYEICKRYRLNTARAQRLGLPLLPKHVEMFSVGASRIKTRDLKGRHAELHLRMASVARLSEMMGSANPFPIVGWTMDPASIPGDPTRMSARFVFDPLLMDKEAQLLLSDAGRLPHEVWQERLCKAVVNRELEEKQIIPAPGAGGRVEYYKIHRRIATGDGLVAYALRPLGADSTLKPLLVFRPTQGSLSNEDALETYLNDIQPNLGEMGYSAAKSRFDQLMRDPKFCPPSGKIEVAGYSLGGTHAQRFVADFWRQVSQATFYNDPGVERELAEQFAQEINGQGPDLSSIRLNIWRTEGDLVHLAGEKHLGWGIVHPQVSVDLFEFNHLSQEISMSELHGTRVLDAQYRNCRINMLRSSDELNRHLDNTQDSAALFYYEQGRKSISGVVYFLLCGFRHLLRLLSSLLGIALLRSSNRVN